MSLIDCCSDILTSVMTKQASLKTLVYSKRNGSTDTKQIYALICNTLKYREILEELILSANLLKQERSLNQNTALLITYQLLFYHGSIRWGKYKAIVTKHKTRLRAELARLKIKRKVVKNEDLLPDHIKNEIQLPRYVRVNLIKSTVQKVIDSLCSIDGYNYIENESASSLANLAAKTIRRDVHLVDLLIFPQKTDLHEHPLFLNGTLILQDKASCFPATMLMPPPGSVCLDACAAPGNKTTHLASLMRNKGKIFAFDADRKRLDTLDRACVRQGATCVESRCVDFKTVDPNDPKYLLVEYMLLDPSCSGSGIVSRLDHLIDQETTLDRLESLAEFQVSVILHAMKFPSVKKISYSTCSIHEIENEMVVSKVLADESAKRWSVLVKNVLPGWDRRGNEGHDGSIGMVRAKREDFTIGFFAVIFVKNKKIG